MRTSIALGTALLLSVAAGFAHYHVRKTRGYGLVSEASAPTFQLPTLAGGGTDLLSLRGKVVVLNFWATWCAPCVEEMPSLERLHAMTRDDGIVVLTVAVDEDVAALGAFVKKANLTLPVLRDPDERVAVGLYRITGYPETFIIDPDGRIRDHVVGAADWSTPEALAHIRAYRRP